MEELRADLLIEVDRVADRLRSLSQAKLTGPVAGHASRAQAARSTAQALADAAALVESGHAAWAAGVVPGRSVPLLNEFAAGDQVAVTGHDLIAALDAAPGADFAPAVQALAADALERLRSLRRLL